MLTGVPVDSVQSATDAARRLRALGAANVIVTLGERGVVAVAAAGAQHFAARPVQAVDTTAAETRSSAALLLRWRRPHRYRGHRVRPAAAAISVTRAGAQTSIPFERESPAASLGFLRSPESTSRCHWYALSASRAAVAGRDGDPTEAEMSDRLTPGRRCAPAMSLMPASRPEPAAAFSGADHRHGISSSPHHGPRSDIAAEP